MLPTHVGGLDFSYLQPAKGLGLQHGEGGLYCSTELLIARVILAEIGSGITTEVIAVGIGFYFLFYSSVFKNYLVLKCRTHIYCRGFQAPIKFQDLSLNLNLNDCCGQIVFIGFC